MFAQLDEDRIAAYVAGELGTAERQAIERALDEQPEWLEVVAALAQDRDPEGPTPAANVAAAATETGTDYAAALERAPILAPGARLGRFEVLGRIAAGGMGVVYAAFDAELQRRVAVKLARHRPRDQAARDRLLREARALAQLSHPNVVSVYDVGTHEGRLYLAMELLEGPTLAAVLRDGGRDWRAVVGLFIQAARGLEAAHRKGIVHRDFKPHNAIVEGDRVVVIDFGLAAAPSGDGRPEDAGEPPELRLATLSRAGGTPAYMAPEQRRGEAVSARSDQYSLAVALHQALYGELPEGAGAGTGGGAGTGTAGTVRQGTRRLQRALSRALAEDPADRFADLGAMIRALEGATRRRWPTFAAAGGIAALAVAGFVAGASTSTPTSAEDPCAGVRDELDASWSEPRKAALAARYAEFDRPYLVTFGERVIAAIDDYAGRWVDVREASCRAALAPETLALERDCLLGLRARLDAYIRALMTADVELAAHALESLEALPKPRICADAEGLRAQAAALPGTADAAAVEAIAAELTEIQLLHEARRIDEALPRVEALERRALALDHPPSMAEVTAERAWILTTKGDLDAASEALDSALNVAARWRVDRLLALLWTRRIWIAYEAGQIDDGRRAAAHADAWIARVGEPPELRFDYYQHLGWLESRAGAPAASLAYFERSREIAEEAELGGRELAIATAGVGTARYSAGDLDGAAEALREAESRLAAALGASHPDVAKIGNNIAAILRAQGDLEGAERIFKRCMETLRQAYGDEHELIGQIQINLGMLALDRGRDEEALVTLERGRELLTASLGDDHPLITIALARRGTALSNLGRYDEADEALRAVLERGLTDGSEDPRTLASIELDIALNLARAGRPAAAIPSYESALARVEASLGADHSSLGPVASGLASALDSVGREREAGPLHRRAIELATPLEEAEFRLRYAEHLFARADYAEAIAAADAALERHEAAPADPRIAAAAHFLRGRARWRLGGAAPEPQARRDVEAARDLYVEAGDGDGRAAVDAWLAEHPRAR
ncbi:MAG: serine/threonine protein kinase [Myxococcales bacterium]|nr:serine/threonine protein kinase [Myxococcales bacterium]